MYWSAGIAIWRLLAQRGPIVTLSPQGLRDVRIACGDWTRVTGPAVRDAGGGIVGMFLDPPYDQTERATVYTMDRPVATEVREWCVANGEDPKLRIVLAGYDGEHNQLESMGWKVSAWNARGGYGSQGEGRGRDNASRERLWLSPLCMGVAPELFTEAAA